MELTSDMVDDICAVTIPGDNLDASNSKEFKRVMAPILESHSKVVFDLSQLKFVDSSGLVAILSCLRQLNAAGGDIKLAGMSKSVRALFELVRMHRIFEIFNTRDEAVSAFQS